MYLELGRAIKKKPRAMEYKSQTPSSIAIGTGWDENRLPMELVMKLPLWYTAAERLSASKRKGNISHNEVRAIRSPVFKRVVLFMPNKLFLNLFIMASDTPDNTKSNKKSIKKEKL